MSDKYMNKEVLKNEFRVLLANNYLLRQSIASDFKIHERTIRRWADSGSIKLTTAPFLAALRKHGKIDKSVELIEQVAIALPVEA